jgi:LPS export ABC transporter protein LptC
MTKFIFFILASMLLASCQNEIAEIKAVTDYFNYPIQSVENADYLYSEVAKKSTRLQAPLLERYYNDTSQIIAPKGFKMTFFSKQGNTDAWLVGNRGEFWEKSGVFHATGDVKMENAEGESMTTERVTFYRDSDLIKTDDWVTIQTKTGTLHGKGLLSNSAFTEYQILQPTGQFNISEP